MAEPQPLVVMYPRDGSVVFTAHRDEGGPVLRTMMVVVAGRAACSLACGCDPRALADAAENDNMPDDDGPRYA